jgi:hypothetical protein
MSNIEVRSFIIINIEDRAKRFHPSTFDILRFCGSAVRFSLVLRFAAEKLTPETRNLKPFVGFEGSRMSDPEFESTFNL